MQVQPYLFFNGRCEEALAFYREAVGAEITMLSRFKDVPDPNMSANVPGDKIMHASLRIGETTILASDHVSQGPPKFEGFSLSLIARDLPEAERLFAALSNGGQVQQPMIKTFFSPGFGVLADRFGVSWMVVVL